MSISNGAIHGKCGRSSDPRTGGRSKDHCITIGRQPPNWPHFGSPPRAGMQVRRGTGLCVALAKLATGRCGSSGSEREVSDKRSIGAKGKPDGWGGIVRCIDSDGNWDT